MTTTPNPTAHQIVAKALDEHAKDYWHGVLPSGFMEDQIIRELRAHGLLSEGAPSEERIEQAARAFVRSSGDDDWDMLHERERESYLRDVRAALTAARVSVDTPGIGAATDSRTQGVTPLNLEKVAEVLRREDWTDEMWDDMPQRDRDRNWELYLRAAHALCEAYTEGKLNG